MNAFVSLNLIRFISIGFLLVSNSIAAQDNNAAKENGLLRYHKCYVEYTGGSDGIQLLYTKSGNFDYLSKILKRKARVVIGEMDKKWVHKVLECVKEESTFRIGRAQVLDKLTPR